ncbi:MAG: VRR-NUC domain-containing protein [Pseudomonadota bacterium]
MTRAAPERAIQIAIKRRLALSGVVCHHSPNAGKRSVIAGRMLKAEGMITGWPDLTLVGPGGRVAFLEVKAEKGRTSAAQDDCLAMLRRMGHDVAVVRSQGDAVLILQEWGWPVR